MDSKTKELQVKGEARKQRPLQGSLSFVVSVKDIPKPIIAKWIFKNPGIQIASGKDPTLIFKILLWLAKVYVDYDGTEAECKIETVNSKLEIKGISQIPLGKLATDFEKNKYIVKYNETKTPPAVSLFLSEPKFTARIFSTGTVNFMGHTIRDNEKFGEEIKESIVAFEKALSLIDLHGEALPVYEEKNEEKLEKPEAPEETSLESADSQSNSYSEKKKKEMKPKPKKNKRINGLKSKSMQEGT